MTVNERIKFLIETLENDNQRQFAAKIGVSATGLNSMLPGNRESKPSYDVLNKILSTYPQVRGSWLVVGKGTPFKTNTVNQAFATEPPATYGKGGGVPAVVTVDSQGRDNVALVRAKARAGYRTGLKDPEFVSELPTYRLPGVDHGTFRMFEVEGHSMYPTLKNKDIVVAEWVENPDQIRDERIYIIVTNNSKNEEGVLIKRCINRLKNPTMGFILAKSDAASRLEYEPIEIHREEIQEIWYARWYMSTQFPAPSDLYNRLTNLEVEMHQLKTLLIS